MATTDKKSIPLVSVIIPCYNHSHYLQEAINSIKNQKYPSIEMIVVDDGSSDNTFEVAKKNKEVTYIYQKNQGLSAARNTGISKSKGEFLVFLDADDWLLPDAILTNVSYLQQDKRLAFVSGAHDKIYINCDKRVEEIKEVTSDHYFNLIQRNYIGMHASVMYARWVFYQFLFDRSLKACEDYDLYLKIARKHSVLHHKKKIAVYRLHSSNMSGQIPLMLTSVLSVLKRQRKSIKTKKERQAYKKGVKLWKEYYCNILFQKLISTKEIATKTDLLTLFIYKPSFGFRYLIKRALHDKNFN